MHEFFVPVPNSTIVTKLRRSADQDTNYHAQQSNREHEYYRVWGMTARILVDAARIAYNREPEFDHNKDAGDEEMITGLRVAGQLGPLKRKSHKKGNL